jgi:hypothetical protein
MGIESRAMMNWFGESWGAPCCKELLFAPTPVGEPCAWCEEVFEEGDSGLLIPSVGEDLKATLSSYHRECFLRSIVGSVGHIKGECPCCGGESGDPPGMTMREAAKAAVEEWERRNVDGVATSN